MSTDWGLAHLKANLRYYPEGSARRAWLLKLIREYGPKGDSNAE